ncbi:unnamed protein product [Spirodela intermedia]|uniref:Uncharacterized protein n=1 Tax=Spirodela intermedia TaxID=51605 RepID=A0A7I8JFC8_SPIIN|nr:unnamed protein product [Spirodela intermedia]CAA6668641.1 unnamed protein product [Spirodela intermedia]
MASPDHLFALRNNFYLGAYQVAISSAERDSLVYRAYIAQGSYQFMLFHEHLTLKILTFIICSKPESVFSSVKEWLNAPAIQNNSVLRLAVGTIFMHEQDYNEALKHTNAGGTMELHALNVQIYLKMQNADYAEKQLRIMQQIDEDHTLTQLATAWHDLAVVGPLLFFWKYIWWLEKFLMTGLVLNGKAVCCMHVGNFDEAETLLLDALTKDPWDLETLANLIVCSIYLGKSSTRFLSQLKLHHPEYMLVKRLSAADEPLGGPPERCMKGPGH